MRKLKRSNMKAVESDFDAVRLQVSVVLNKIDILRDMAVDVEEFTLKMRDPWLSFSASRVFCPMDSLGIQQRNCELGL